jgi:hypothetical protein
MKGLRVYINLKRPDTRSAGAVFYTRLAGGPFYQWRYEELRGQWLGSRIHAGDVLVTELVSAPWKGIPPALKTSLVQHYVE